MIKEFLIAYLILSGLSFLMYLPKIVQFFYAFKKPPYKKATEKRKIALVVPALYESKVIGDLFASIEKQDYEREFFQVHVIVKDESDPTVKMAKDLGFRVFVVPEQTCKGEALDGYFAKLEKDVFESLAAFAIVDADAVLTPDYVRELNNALEHNYDIFLSRKFIKNYLGDKSQRTVFSNCSALTYSMLDNLGNNYRMEHDLPMNMCGQGMMIRRKVIETLGGWPYRTLTEDYELKLDSVLKGFRSMYYPYAIIYTEEVLRHKESYHRRLRWVTGYTQCDKKYKKQIKRQIRSKGATGAEKFEYFFALVPIIFFLAVTIFTMIYGSVVSVFYAVHGSALWKPAFLALVAFPFTVTYLLTFLYCTLAMLAYRDVFKPLSAGEKAGTLLFAPLFMLEYFPIYIQSRIRYKKKAKWEPTQHVVYETAVTEKMEEEFPAQGKNDEGKP